MPPQATSVSPLQVAPPIAQNPRVIPRKMPPTSARSPRVSKGRSSGSSTPTRPRDSASWSWCWPTAAMSRSRETSSARGSARRSASWGMAEPSEVRPPGAGEVGRGGAAGDDGRAPRLPRLGPGEGVGPALAARIVDALGAGALELIDREPSALRRIPGIGAKKAKAITAALASQRGIRDFVTFLGNQGSARTRRSAFGTITAPTRSASCARTPGASPTMCGVSVFEKPTRSPESWDCRATRPSARARAPLRAGRRRGNGHSCLPRADLLARTSQLLGIEEDKALEALDENVERKSIVRETWAGGDDEGDALFLPPLAAAERTAARRIRALLAAKLPPPLADARAIDASARRASITLDPHQRSAVEAALRDRILVITGGPGVGKTTIVRLIVDLARSNGRTILLASPTGAPPAASPRRPAPRPPPSTGCWSSIPTKTNSSATSTCRSTPTR